MRNDWISVYLYSDLKLELVIVNLIDTIVDELKNLNYLKSYFFIRYWEGGEHIRLRVLTEYGKDVATVGSLIEKKAVNYFNEHNDCQKYRIEFVPYEREIKRYGGEIGMDLSEVLFRHSSQTVISIIKDYCCVWNNSIAIAFAIKMHVIFTKKIVKENMVIAKIFENVFENWIMHSVKQNELNQTTAENIGKVKVAFERTFLEQKNKILKIVRSVCLNVDGEGGDCEWERKWSQSCLYLCNKITSEDRITQAQLLQFCDNHIHMTNNRLGVYLRDESFIAFMLYKIFSKEVI